MENAKLDQSYGLQNTKDLFFFIYTAIIMLEYIPASLMQHIYILLRAKVTHINKNVALYRSF